MRLGRADVDTEGASTDSVFDGSFVGRLFLKMGLNTKYIYILFVEMAFNGKTKSITWEELQV